jgi:hypothetical protein
MFSKSIRDVSLLSASVVFVWSAIAVAGCSSAGDDGDGAGGATPMAGAATTAGTGVGGSTGGTSAGGATFGGAPPGGAGAPSGTMCAAIGTPQGCSGIRTGGACTMEGQACPGLPCGVSDVGRRVCNCTGGTWMCESCTYPMDFTACPIMEPPGTLPACAGAADTVPCSSTRGQRCMAGTEVCICWPDDEGTVAWDCDSVPIFWGAVTTQ